MERLAARQLKMLDAEEARVVEYMAHPSEVKTQPEHSPALLLADLGILVAINGPILWFLRRRRRKSAAQPAPADPAPTPPAA
jgi:hypothetical protein